MFFIVTNSNDETTNYLCEKFKITSIEYVRFNTDHKLGEIEVKYVDQILTLVIDGKTVTPRDISNVWFRRPKNICHNLGDDNTEKDHINGEWSEVFENFFSQIEIDKWINLPVNNFFASHKLRQLKIASELGLKIPKTLLTQNENELRGFFEECKSEIIVKPIRSGFLERNNGEDSLIYTNVVTINDLMDGFLLRNCPCLFQQRIDKIEDYRITIIDKNVTAVKLIKKEFNGKQILDIRKQNMDGVEYSLTSLPIEIETKLLKLMETFQLRFAAIDLAIDSNGDFYFFEINPNGQWAWMDIIGVTEIYKGFTKLYGY